MKKTIKREKREHIKKPDTPVIFTAVLLVVFFVYIIGMIMNLVTKPKITVETLALSSAKTGTEVRGVIVRDEVVYFSDDVSGQAVYYYNNNEKVKKDSVIMSISESSAADSIYTQIDQVEKDIMKIQSEKIETAVYKTEYSFIANKIRDTINSSSFKLADGSYETLYTFKDGLKRMMSERNNLLLLESTSNVEGLVNKKSLYEEQLKNYIKNFQTNESGLLSFYIDGYEGVFTKERMASLTKEEVNIDAVFSSIKQGKNIEKSAPLFKIVKSNKWYICCYISNKDIETLNEGQRLFITGVSGDNTKNFVAELESVYRGDTESYVIFAVNERVQDFLEQRTIDFRIRETTHEGILIPKAAILEKVLLVVPTEYIVNDNVIVKDDQKDEMHSVNVVDKNSEQGVSYILTNENSGIASGSVLIKPNDPNRALYTISEVKGLKGVYVANTSLAKFKTIGEIMVETTDYVIVRVNTGGVKVFDKIVSKAVDVKENQRVY